MKSTNWKTSGTASEELGVSQETLMKWCELDYLHEGTHWKFISTNNKKGFFFRGRNKNKTVIYHLPWCKEAMNKWKDRDARIPRLVA